MGLKVKTLYASDGIRANEPSGATLIDDIEGDATGWIQNRLTAHSDEFLSLSGSNANQLIDISDHGMSMGSLRLHSVVSLSGTLNLGKAGDIFLGDGTLRKLYPQTDLKIDLGDSTHRFMEAFISQSTFYSLCTFTELPLVAWQSTPSNPTTDRHLATKKYVDDEISSVGTQLASTVSIAEIEDATYDTVQDWINTTQSSGKISGGTITDSGSGEIDIAAGTGFIKEIHNSLGDTVIFDWSAETNVSLTNYDVNYIYIDYNGGSPQSGVTITQSDIHFTDHIGLGRVYRDDDTLHILSAGVQIHDATYRTHKRLVVVDGFIRASGLVTTETGTRNFKVTAGKIWNGLTEISFAEVDTNSGGTFTYYYQDGGTGWSTVTNQTQIDNTQYDDGDGALGTLTANQYGVHWVYLCNDGSLHVVYGQDSYKLGEAKEVASPSSTPTIITDFSLLASKIIIEKDASSFTEIHTPWETDIAGSVVADHTELSNIGTNTHVQIDTHVDNAKNMHVDWSVVSDTPVYSVTTSVIDHDTLSNFAANEHIDWTSTSDNFSTTGTLGTGTITLTDGSNIAVNTTTGTKIGTSTSQKLGFYNVTPVNQPDAIADADISTALATLNAVLARLRELGLIAT